MESSDDEIGEGLTWATGWGLEPTTARHQLHHLLVATTRVRHVAQRHHLPQQNSERPVRRENPVSYRIDITRTGLVIKQISGKGTRHLCWCLKYITM